MKDTDNFNQKQKLIKIKLDFNQKISYIEFMQEIKEIKQTIINHPRNNRVVFNEKAHSYFVDGNQYKGVTGWIGEFCSPFNAKKIAKKLSETSPNWNHLTPEEILQLWDDAREYGNYVDDLIEKYVNEGIGEDEPELQQFVKFLKDYNLTPLKAQWVIFNEDVGRASAIDVVCLNEASDVVVLDIKTMENGVDVKAFQNKKMAYPLLLPESRYYKFSLQLGIYQKWLIEKYGMSVHHTNYVVRIRPELYEVIPTIDVSEQIKSMETFGND